MSLHVLQTTLSDQLAYRKMANPPNRKPIVSPTIPPMVAPIFTVELHVHVRDQFNAVPRPAPRIVSARLRSFPPELGAVINSRFEKMVGCSAPWIACGGGGMIC